MAAQTAELAEYDPKTLRKGEYDTPDREYPSTTPWRVGNGRYHGCNDTPDREYPSTTPWRVGNGRYHGCTGSAEYGGIRKWRMTTRDVYRQWHGHTRR